ncbi:MAG: hypothetical protein K6360_05915 [Deltaproteobacteria bacterium]
MIDLDISLFVEIVAVLILMAILNSMLYKPMRRMLEEREARLSGLRGDVERFERNATQLVEDFQKRLADARKAGAQEKERLKEEGRVEERRLLAEGSKEAEGKKQQLMAEITSAIDAARKDLAGMTEGFAKTMAEKILGRSL